MSTVSLPSTVPPRKLVATCPSCETQYKIKPNMSGRKAKCGKCQTRMRIPTLRAKLNDVAEKAKRRLAASTQASFSAPMITAIPGVRGTGTGLLMNAWGVVIVLAVLVAAITMQFVAPTQLMEFRYYLGGGLGFGALLAFAGLLTCSSVPKQSGARGWILAAISFSLLQIGVAGYIAYSMFNNIPLLVTETAINFTSAGLGILSFFCFMFFVKNSARSMMRPELSATARGVMWAQLLICSVACGTVALAYTLPPTEGSAILLQALAIGTLITTLVVQIIAIVLNFQLGSHMRRRELIF